MGGLGTHDATVDDDTTKGVENRRAATKGPGAEKAGARNAVTEGGAAENTPAKGAENVPARNGQEVTAGA